MDTTRRSRTIRHLRRFRDDVRGSISVEFVIIVPVLFWALMAVYSYFDGYRQSATNLKAANTIADLISRETAAVNDGYIDSMFSLMELMVGTDGNLSMRITLVRWDAEDGRYYVSWSKVRNRETALSDGNISEIETLLPVMSDDDYVILVETENTFVPIFNVGLDDIALKNFVFSRPRFAPQVAWSDA